MILSPRLRYKTPPIRIISCRGLFRVAKSNPCHPDADLISQDLLNVQVPIARTRLYHDLRGSIARLARILSILIVSRGLL